MSLDASKPGDTDLVSLFAGYLRETRSEVNSNFLSSPSQTINVDNIIGNEFKIGEDVTDSFLEIVFLEETAIKDISNITGGRAGQVKVFINNGIYDITFKHNVLKFILKGDIDFLLGNYDCICLVNQEGDPDLGNDGFWIELFRTEH